MTALKLFRRVAFVALIAGVPVLAGVIGVLLLSGGGSERVDRTEAVATSTVASAASSQEERVLPSPTPLPPTPLPPTPTAAPTSPTPIPNRADCDVIRGTDYVSTDERTWYLENCVMTASAPVPVATVAPTIGNEGGPIRGSNDRIVIERLGIDAPVNYRTVEEDGVLGNPLGASDVVWYDFSNLRGMGGYPGRRGNAVYAGHVDYYGVGPAVFWNLRNIQEGDIIEISTSEGVYRYAVDWFGDFKPEDNWNSIVASGTGEVATLVTCIGTFNPESGYSNRRVVRATRIE